MKIAVAKLAYPVFLSDYNIKQDMHKCLNSTLFDVSNYDDVYSLNQADNEQMTDRNTMKNTNLYKRQKQLYKSHR